MEGGNSIMKEKQENVIKHNEERPFNLRLQDEIDYATIGRHMRDVRRHYGYTQAQLSEILSLKPNATYPIHLQNTVFGR